MIVTEKYNIESITMNSDSMIYDNIKSLRFKSLLRSASGCVIMKIGKLV